MSEQLFEFETCGGYLHVVLSVNDHHIITGVRCHGTADPKTQTMIAFLRDVLTGLHMNTAHRLNLGSFVPFESINLGPVRMNTTLLSIRLMDSGPRRRGSWTAA